MNLVESTVLVLHVLAAISVCGFVLLQHGKAADMGAAFGSGSSGSLFGAAGSANFLSRTTAVIATVFFLTSVALTYLGSQHGAVPQGVMEKGLMEKGAVEQQSPPAQPSDVPQPAPGTNSTPAAASNGVAPADVPKSNEVPK
jgi:preprotein translocase subunit SecG